MERSLVVVKPGPLSTVQDLGRVGVQHLGFSPSGAADADAVAIGNRLLANEPDAAAIEVTLGGAAFRFACPSAVAITGADAPALLDERPLAPWQTHAVAAGSLLRIGAARHGARVYLCVRGGIDVPPLYGSRSTDLLAQIGGYEGRALRADDRLPLGPAPALLHHQRLAASLVPLQQRLIVVRAVPGPQQHTFTAPSQSAFFSSLYRVSPRTDRTGLFLDGPRLFHAGSADILSEGVTAGSVQVPATGQPLILMGEHRSIGGYTKIATVCSVDLPRLGQARPGDLVMLMAVDHQTARRARVALAHMKEQVTVVAKDHGPDGPAPLWEGWLERVTASAVEAIKDERLPLLLSDLERLSALVGARERAAEVAATLRLQGQVVTPDADYPALRVCAPASGTLLLPPDQDGALPVGAALALLWSPGRLSLITVGHPLAQLSACRCNGAWVASGDVLFEGGFQTALLFIQAEPG